MKTIRLALDWTPNTLHAGFLYAQKMGWYHEAGLNVELVSPEEDQYMVTPTKRLALGNAHFAIAPSESVLSYRTLPKSIPIVAVAALLQEDTSAIASLKSSNIQRPKQLDGKVYASFAARFEDCIVKRMIRNDGGFGMLQVTNPKKLGIWNTLLQQEADASWIFLPWEGIEAKIKNIELETFQLEEYGVPYGYSPLLLTHKDILEEYPDSCYSFMEVNQKAHRFVNNHPTEAADFLCKNVEHENFRNEELIEESLKMLSGKWEHTNGWGYMDEKVWSDFIHWLITNKVLCDIEGGYLERVKDEYTSYYTNAYLKG
jgi:NitT/TauT family transport system substrate-binding protein